MKMWSTSSGRTSLTGQPRCVRCKCTPVVLLACAAAATSGQRAVGRAAAFAMICAGPKGMGYSLQCFALGQKGRVAAAALSCCRPQRASLLLIARCLPQTLQVLLTEVQGPSLLPHKGPGVVLGPSLAARGPRVGVRPFPSAARGPGVGVRPFPCRTRARCSQLSHAARRCSMTAQERVAAANLC